MDKKAQKHYEQLYGRQWDEFNPAERAQFEKAEADKKPRKGEKLLKEDRVRYHLFPKKPKYVAENERP